MKNSHTDRSWHTLRCDWGWFSRGKLSAIFIKMKEKQLNVRKCLGVAWNWIVRHRVLAMVKIPGLRVELLARMKLLHALALAFCFLYGANVDAQSVEQQGPNYFIAGIPTSEFEDFAAPHEAGKQRQANWCWAAAIQMVLNYHGLYVSQEQIVQRIYGGLIDQPAGAEQILQALSGWALDVRGRASSIYATTYIFKGSDIVGDLAMKWPIIVGLRGDPIGHAYVLTAVYYSVDSNNEPIFDRVVLRIHGPLVQAVKS